MTAIGLDPSGYVTHSLRRTKAAQIYRKTGNLSALLLLLGHAKVDSTVRCLGVAWRLWLFRPGWHPCTLIPEPKCGTALQCRRFGHGSPAVEEFSTGSSRLMLKVRNWCRCKMD